MAYILEYINHEFNGSIRDGNFYDLGSGMGKGVVAMSLLCHFKKLIGIEFLHGNFLEQSWDDTSIMFANSTCFSENLMKSIATKANNECKKGTIIITFTKRLTTLNSDWELRDGFQRLMTWGIATVYIHRRK